MQLSKIFHFLNIINIDKYGSFGPEEIYQDKNHIEVSLWSIDSVESFVKDMKKRGHDAFEVEINQHPAYMVNLPGQGSFGFIPIPLRTDPVFFRYVFIIFNKVYFDSDEYYYYSGKGVKAI